MKALDLLEKKAPEVPEASESEDAAKDILGAIASKDAKALDLALQRHYACCEGEDEDEGVADEED
jgi:hypothetical protein